jgi:hypothetical protein
VHARAEALSHIQNTVSQYNLPPLATKLNFAANRVAMAELFTVDGVGRMVELDLAVIQATDEQIRGGDRGLRRQEGKLKPNLDLIFSILPKPPCL